MSERAQKSKNRKEPVDLVRNVMIVMILMSVLFSLGGGLTANALGFRKCTSLGSDISLIGLIAAAFTGILTAKAWPRARATGRRYGLAWRAGTLLVGIFLIKVFEPVLFCSLATRSGTLVAIGTSLTISIIVMGLWLLYLSHYIDRQGIKPDPASMSDHMDSDPSP